ncbi:MAG: DUF4432 family protein, partial [Acidobacteria bacterium]
GPPLLEAGAVFQAPIARATPRDAYPAEAVKALRHYPEPGSSRQEEVYFIELLGANSEGKTLAVLHNAAREKAVALRFSLSQLPFFTLWKYAGCEQDGYVTGLEPGTSYPNFRSVERELGRLRVLQPGETQSFELEIEAHDQPVGVSRLLKEIGQLQGEQGG